MLESFSACGSFVHTPRGPRKSGIPDSVEMPAPVRTTMCLASSTHLRTEAIEGSREIICLASVKTAPTPRAREGPRARLPLRTIGDQAFDWFARARGQTFLIHVPFLTPQFEPLYLSSCRLRQLGEELDPTRIFVGRELFLDVLPERGLQRIASRVALLEDDKGLRLDELVLVFGADHRRFEHRFVRDESGFDFSGRDVDA